MNSVPQYGDRGKSAWPLQGRRVVLGVSGGVATYKVVEFVRLLVREYARVQVVMTDNATRFVSPLTFQAVSGNSVFTELFSLQQDAEIGHIRVAEDADLFVVAPATANTLAGIAAGTANNPVTAVALATQAPTLLAPSMNSNMWTNAATQRNMSQLRGRQNVFTVGPEDGFLACKWVGLGRLAEPVQILEAAARILTPSDLEGLHIVVTAGPTHERLDPVRFLTNRSSGKMGYALAHAAVRRGASVSLVSGPTALSPPSGVQYVPVQTAQEMRDAVFRAMPGQIS